MALSKVFKSLEPLEQPPPERGAAINHLYYIHDRKMALLNQSVYDLIKVQDLVNRLLHESLGGDLVNTSKADWERTQLTRENIKKSIEAKRANGSVSPSDSDSINAALRLPNDTQHAKTAKTYRNRLMHHIRPSVDYSMFFSNVESREGQEVKDEMGKVIGRQWAVYARQPAQYTFNDLHLAFSEYLNAVAATLQELSKLEILRR